MRKYTTDFCFRVLQKHKCHIRAVEFARSHLRSCRSFRIDVHEEVQFIKQELRFCLPRRLSFPMLMIPAVDGAFLRLSFPMLAKLVLCVVSVYYMANLEDIRTEQP